MVYGGDNALFGFVSDEHGYFGQRGLNLFHVFGERLKRLQKTPGTTTGHF